MIPTITMKELFKIIMNERSFVDYNLKNETCMYLGRAYKLKDFNMWEWSKIINENLCIGTLIGEYIFVTDKQFEKIKFLDLFDPETRAGERTLGNVLNVEIYADEWGII